MKRLMTLVLISGIVFLFSISNASAIGLGAYYQLGWGKANWKWDDNGTAYNDSLDHRGRLPGFVLDTNVAQDQVFNYRLQLGLDQIKVAGGGKATGYVMDHIFGFGVVRNEFMRLWVGPQLHLSYYDDADWDSDFRLFGLGGGPAVGVNIHAGDTVSFCITNGFLLSSQLGEAANGFDFSGYETLFYINFSVLFRINDAYRPYN